MASFLIFAAAAATLRLMGRVWWCQVGDLGLWSGDIASAHNSQHLIDPYTFTHILHGIGLYAVAWALLKNWLSPIPRGVFALAVEAIWEVIENTPTVIERYRETTISLGYYGDSVINSMGDLVACAAGYALAMFAPAWFSAIGFALTEILLLIWIKDSLILNILMLIRPTEAIRAWQAGS